MDEAKQALISVIIPVYHTPASLLHICLESIAKTVFTRINRMYCCLRRRARDTFSH